MKLMTTPRIIGIICLAVAIASSIYGLTGAWGVGLAGIILLLAPTKHAVNRYDHFIDTLKRWKTLIYTILLDAVFWTILFVTFIAFERYATGSGESLNLDRSQLLNDAAVQQNVAVVQGLLSMMLIGLFVLICVNILTYAFTRGQMWLLLTNKKAKEGYWKKFLGLSFAWWGAWVAFMTLVAAGMRPDTLSYAFAIVLLIAAYFTTFVQFLFTKSYQVWRSIGGGIKLGLESIPKMIVPFAFVIVAYVILFQLFRIIPATAALYSGAQVLFIIITVALIRAYVYELIKR